MERVLQGLRSWCGKGCDHHVSAFLAVRVRLLWHRCYLQVLTLVEDLIIGAFFGVARRRRVVFETAALAISFLLDHLCSLSKTNVTHNLTYV